MGYCMCTLRSCGPNACGAQGGGGAVGTGVCLYMDGTLGAGGVGASLAKDGMGWRDMMFLCGRHGGVVAYMFSKDQRKLFQHSVCALPTVLR